MNDPFRDHKKDWLQSSRANYTPQRIDTTTKNSADFEQPCQHIHTVRIANSDRVKCLECRKVARAQDEISHAKLPAAEQ